MTYAKGIDVSTYQTLSEWSPEGLSFLVARASIGLLKDDLYDFHIAKAKAAGLITGAYHYNWDNSSPETQAQFFVKSAGDVDLYFLDVEGSKAFTADESRRFIAEVQRLGKRVGLYMSASVYRWAVGQNYDWIALWTSTPPKGDWEFWQYSDGSGIDRNYFNGTAAELAAFVASLKGQDMRIKRVKGADYKVTGSSGPIFADASRAAAKIASLSTGKVIRAIAELVGSDGADYRLVEYNSQAGFIVVTNPDGSAGSFQPVVATGDPAIDADLNAFLAGADLKTQAELDAAVAAATAGIQQQLAAAELQLNTDQQAIDALQAENDTLKAQVGKNPEVAATLRQQADILA